MDKHAHNSLSITSAGGHLKRRRGRPRKDHSFASGAHSPVSCEKGVTSNMFPKVEPRLTEQNLNIGQPIDGVIEAVVDAGYLLKVKLSTGTTLRGVIFKPGQYVPFSYENDVAPNAQLIRRNNVSWSPKTKRRRRRQTKGNVNELYHTVNGAPVEHPVIAATPTICKFVPVVLPSSLSLPNWIPRSPAPHLMSSINQQSSTFAPKVPPFVNGSAPCHQRDTHIAASAVPFQQLLDEVTKRTQTRPVLSASHLHGEVSDVEEPLSVEPLQAIEPYHTENHTREVKVIKLYKQESVSKHEEGSTKCKPVAAIGRQ